MPVPMLDLKAQYALIKHEIDAVVADVFQSQLFRGGPYSEAFERDMAIYTGTTHAIGVSSGTDALYLALKAMKLQPGEEVLTSPFTFFATAGAIVNAGGAPVFVDIDPLTYTLDPALVSAAITPRTRAIIPVHLYGQCADMNPLLDLAKKHGLTIIEDNAQSLGARYQNRPAGSMGDMAAISFYPTKNLGAAGEGGMIITQKDDLARQLRMLRCHGGNAQYVHEIVGTNSHLHALQAAVLGVKLRHLDEWNDARREHAAYYTAAFCELDGVTPPVESPGNHHVYHQYVIRLPRRNAARTLFQTRGIDCGVFYPTPLHKQACFAQWCAQTSCPLADQASQEVLALPMFPELTHAQQDEVITAVREHLVVG